MTQEPKCASCGQGNHTRCRELLAMRAESLNSRPVRDDDLCNCLCRKSKRRPQHDTQSSPAPQHRVEEY